MTPQDRENQLELFDLANQPAARMRRESFGRIFVHLRYDQALLLAIGALLALTVIFAGGVERGKQLVRAETLRVARSAPTEAPAQPKASEPKAAAEPAKKPEVAQPPKVVSPSAPAMAPKSAKPKTRVAAAGSSRYAIQVATYAKLGLAKQEMQRLRAGGDAAFIVIRNGHTVVFAGPFPSRNDASEKLADLKSRYEDCFIKTL